MSLFGAKKQTASFKEQLERAKENYEKRMESASSEASAVSSSHIGDLLEESTAPGSPEALGGPVVLPRDVYNEAARMHNKEAQEQGHLSQVVSTVHGRSSVDEDGNEVYKQPRVYMIPSDDGSSLSSPTPTTNYGGSEVSFLSQTPRERVLSPLPATNTSYGGSEISFPVQTPREKASSPASTTNYEGSLLGFSPSAVPSDLFSTPRASAGIIVKWYIQSEENTSQHANEDEEDVGEEETRKVDTPIPRKFEISDSSDDEDDTMTEVEWRNEEVYMTPTKKGKKRNKGKGVQRPVTPERPIPNMPQTPSRRKLEADWAKPADEVTNEKKEVNLEVFIGEYLKNTNGLRDFMINKAKYDDSYLDWCGEQASHIAARQNHTDVAVGSTRKIAQIILTEVELEREYAVERAEKLDERLSKIEKKLAKIAPVNMAKTIENALKSCMEEMIDQLTDKVVKRFENAAEEDRKKEEIRKGKQVEATPEEKDMSNMEFEPGATFSEEENEKVAMVIEQMQVDEEELEVSKHAPVISPGKNGQEFPRYTPSGQVTIAKRPVAPAVLEQKKKEAKKPEVNEILKGPKAEGKKPEVKKPNEKKPEKKLEDKKNETWAQRVAAPPPPPPKKQPEQQQQQQQSGQQQKKRGDGFVEVKKKQSKNEEMKLVTPGQNTMEKRRVTFKRDNGLPLSQKKDLDISLEVNRALFEAKVPHFVRIQGVTKNTRGCLSTITAPQAMAEKLIRYREIVIKAARKVSTGIVDIEMNGLWERVKMHGVNFDRYLGKKTGGGLEKLRQELQAENEGVVLPLAIN